MPFTRLILTAWLLCAAPPIAALQSAPNFSGHWSYQENGEALILDLTQDLRSGSITGTITMLDATVPVAGRESSGRLVIDQMGGIPLAATGGAMIGQLDAGTLMLTVTAAGDAPKTIRMTRAGATPADSGAFEGRWESVADDGTSASVLDLSVSGASVSGTAIDIERGYFSRRETIKARMEIQGSVRNGKGEVALADSGTSVQATLFRRDKYLILQIGHTERGFARPGQPLVESADHSTDAAALGRAIARHVYSISSQTSGRGAFVGGRMRLALCADGRVEYDVSDLASAPGAIPGQGASFGGSTSRRGMWSIVLRAGAPAVQATWQGTGTSYSLTRYFDVRVAPDGRSATVDGISLPAAGTC